MRNIKFDTVTKTFECDNGIEIKFNLPMEGVDVESINFDEYKVELLINPLLDKEINAFALCKKTDKGRDTIGAVFNKDALNSTQIFKPYIAECIFVAFKDCLEKQELQSEEVELSSFYEDNVSICVINKKRAGNDNPLHLCIHSLREYGYSYFEEDNKFKVPKGYDAFLYIKPNQTNINVEFIEPNLYSNGMVDTIIRHLPYANNIAYRFILLYQIIELLMENAGYQLIKDSAEKYISKKISTNDFTETVKSVNVEREIIAKMFNMCKVSSEHGCSFRRECRNHFCVSGCDSDKSSCLPDVFYSFRNLLTHSYRKVHAYPRELALVIQRFELVVLDIVKTYPNIGILFFFKYFNFFVQSFVDAFSLFGAEMNVHTLKIRLPVGISFYTFTALSYSIDVYQRKVEPTRDLLAYLAYVTFFPSILSGPISRAQKQMPQYFKKRSFDYDKAVSACKILLLGGE